MAKQYRKLQEKLYQKPTKKNDTKKVGKDYILMAVTLFTIFITVAGWQSLDNLSRAMYSLLAVSLTLTYASRHASLSDKAKPIVERASLGTMVVAIVLFAASLYFHFTA